VHSKKNYRRAKCLPVFHFFYDFLRKFKNFRKLLTNLTDNVLYGRYFQGGFSVILIPEVAVNKVFIRMRRFKNHLEKIEIQVFKSVRKQDTLLIGVRLLPILCKTPCFPKFKGGKQKDFAAWHNNCLENIH